MAIAYDAGSPAHRALLQADDVMTRNELPPAAVDGAQDEDSRLGWTMILNRTDRSAALLIQDIQRTRGRVLLPFHSRLSIDPATRCGAEWAHRLQRTARTASAALVANWYDVKEMFIDPLTAAPAVPAADGAYSTTLPRRLPEISPLDEVILDRGAWLRTRDGSLYPIRQERVYLGRIRADSRKDPWIGPLACLLAALLDDIAADTTRAGLDASPGLSRLLAQAWPSGTINRAELLEARDGD